MSITIVDALLRGNMLILHAYLESTTSAPRKATIHIVGPTPHVYAHLPSSVDMGEWQQGANQTLLRLLGPPKNCSNGGIPTNVTDNFIPASNFRGAQTQTRGGDSYVRSRHTPCHDIYRDTRGWTLLRPTPTERGYEDVESLSV